MHREERDFTIVLNVAAEFDENYEGEADGYAWFERFESVLKPRLVAAVFDALRSDPEFRVTHAPRGRDPERAIEIEIVHRVTS